MQRSPVRLVGAGPGDPELLTLRAVQALQEATLILVDDLVPEVILQRHASPQARQVWVGKRGGCRSTPQAFIQRLMIRAALRGERVVRLKGGDPFVFGRGGEEREALEAAGLCVEVVNGITSGLAASSAIGVPWTHRSHAQGVVLVTGHCREDGTPMDWSALATSALALRLTLVIYMGVRDLPQLAQGLIAGAGERAGTWPAAVVESVACSAQRHWVGSVATLAPAAQAHSFRSPSIIIVGDVLKGLSAAQPSDVCEGNPLTHNRVQSLLRSLP
jgi:uroporphyrin-III C-methyltransferase